MYDDMRDMMAENLRLNKENNRLLRKMKRAANFGILLKLIWLAILIGVPVALYVYLKPYYEGFQENIGEFGDEIRSIPGIGFFLNEERATTTGEE